MEERTSYYDGEMEDVVHESKTRWAALLFSDSKYSDQYNAVRKFSSTVTRVMETKILNILRFDYVFITTKLLWTENIIFTM